MRLSVPATSIVLVMNTEMTAAERTLRAQVAAHESWARTTDRAARTEPARRAMLQRFERQVDPEGKLAPAVRAKLAENARQAYYKRLAYLSARARRRRGTMQRKGSTRPGGAR